MPPNDAERFEVARVRWRVARGLLLEVRPLPMGAALLTVLLGALWAGAALDGLPQRVLWILAAVFFGLLTAHLIDSLVDVVHRKDRTPQAMPLLFRDSTGLLAKDDYWAALIASIGLCFLCLLGLWRAGGGFEAALLQMALVLAVLYPVAADRSMAGVTFGYPAGATAVLLASFVAAGGGFDPSFAALAGSFFLALVGIKVRSDVIDIEGDRKIGKRTVAAVFGPRAAAVGGYALAIGGLAAAAAIPLAFPITLLFALPPIGAVAAFAMTVPFDATKASLWMSHAMLAALAAEVAVLALS